MSDILIRGMELPKNHRKMILMENGDITDIDGRTIAKAIELPPHGRLGDLDEMAVDESEAYMSAQLKLGDDVITKAINEAVHAKIVRLIADTPTIVPAEEG